MNSPSPPDPDRPSWGRVAVVACGALSVDISAIADANGWTIDIHPLPPLLHNHPERIADEVDQLLTALAPEYDRMLVGYADCGTYGALDAVCERHGVARLPGAHCYDVYAGADEIARMSAEEPGTYFLTDFLAAGFDRLVWRELGLDRHPELREDYFRHYRRVIWLAVRRTADLERAARRAAERLGLPLEVRDLPTSTREGALVAALRAAVTATDAHSRGSGSGN